MTTELDQSYDRCVQIARAAARNFYYGFRMLPREKRRSICAVYAFMRYADDAVDSASGDHAQALCQWEGALEAAYASGSLPLPAPILPAFRDTVMRYGLPRQWFRELMEGVRTDLGPVRFSTPDELDRYCYRVAGVVGLICLRIWGADNYARADPLAVDCGTAFQMTNILRDVKEDAERDRVYLPHSELSRCHVDESALRSSSPSEEALHLIRSQIERAEGLYARSAALTPMISPDCRATFLAMFLIYRELLAQIRRDPAAVFSRRVALPPIRKAMLAMKALLMVRRGVLPGS